MAVLGEQLLCPCQHFPPLVSALPELPATECDTMPATPPSAALQISTAGLPGAPSCSTCWRRRRSAEQLDLCVTSCWSCSHVQRALQLNWFDFGCELLPIGFTGLHRGLQPILEMVSFHLVVLATVNARVFCHAAMVCRCCRNFCEHWLVSKSLMSTDTQVYMKFTSLKLQLQPLHMMTWQPIRLSQ